MALTTSLEGTSIQKIKAGLAEYYQASIEDIHIGLEPENYMMATVRKDGRTISGLIQKEAENEGTFSLAVLVIGKG